MAKEEAHATAAAPASAAGGSQGPLLLLLVNTLVIVTTMGLLYYTKLAFKRPPITERKERARLAAEHARKRKISTEAGLVPFEQVTINIETNPPAPKPVANAPGTVNGKMHFATLAFSLEVGDLSRKDELEAIRPKVLDQVISMLGHKTFAELTTVQGRYVVKTKIMDTANQLIAQLEREASHKKEGEASNDAKDEAKPPLVTNVYFSQFIVQ